MIRRSEHYVRRMTKENPQATVEDLTHIHNNGHVIRSEKKLSFSHVAEVFVKSMGSLQKTHVRAGGNAVKRIGVDIFHLTINTSIGKVKGNTAGGM